MWFGCSTEREREGEKERGELIGKTSPDQAVNRLYTIINLLVIVSVRSVVYKYSSFLSVFCTPTNTSRTNTKLLKSSIFSSPILHSQTPNPDTMAANTFTKDATFSIPPAKLFKAFILDDTNFLHKVAPQVVKSVECVQGDGGAGTIKLVTFGEG